MASGPRRRPMSLCLQPPSAKPSLIAARVFVQTVPARISRLARRLMLMLLVNRPAAAPYSAWRSHSCRCSLVSRKGQSLDD